MKKRLMKLVVLVFVTTLCISMLPTTALAVETEAEIVEEKNTSESDLEIVASGLCGSTIVWKLDSNGNLTISGTGAMDYEGTNAPWYSYRSDIRTVTIAYGVTSIGDWAFSSCDGLTNVTIPNGVTSIGSYTFASCSNLSGITLPRSVTSIGDYAFTSCSSLTSVLVTSDSITNIGKRAFSNCSSLSSIIIPNGLTSIGAYMFYGCSSLTEITIPDSVTNIDKYAFNECWNLTDVYYTGSEDSWKAVSIGAYNDSVANATIHYEWKSITTCEVHTYGEWVVIKEATKTETGVQERTCVVCGETETGEIPITVYKIISGTCGKNLTYVLYSNGNLTISGIGAMNDFNSFNSPWSNYRNNIYSVTITDGVTSIGNYAFYYHSGLTNIEISDSVTSIGNYAFYECSLTNVEIPGSVTNIGDYAFYNCRKLSNVKILESVTSTSIGNYAFYNCSGLTNVEIPKSVTNIGNYAFYNCSGLINVEIPESVTIIGDYAFYNCSKLYSVKISESVASTIIGDYAFYGCSSLTNIEIPESVTNIGDSAFCGCSSLTNVEIPDSVTSIGSGAFYGCSSLTNVEISESVTNTSIGNGAFYGCSSLTSIVIPNSVTYIGKSAFRNCINLTDVTLSDYMYSIEYGTFYGCSNLTRITLPELLKGIDDYAFLGCGKLTSITLPDTLTSIGSYAFANCTRLTEIVIPYRVSSIGSYAFNNCSSLTGIAFTGALESIGDYAFADCVKLNNVTLPDTLTSIGSYAFANCIRLTEIIIPYRVSSIGSYAFNNCSSLTRLTCTGVLESIGDYAFADCGKLTSVTLPDSLTSIGSYAFYNCARLTEIIIPDHVNSIGSYTFWNCKRLTSVTLPNDLIIINEGMFYDCSSLTSVTISNSVTEIGYGAFYDCIKLKDVYYSGSEAQWNTIEINSEGNEYLISATKHYAVVTEPLDIITQPNSVSAYENDTVTLTVEATGDNLTYQWYYMMDNSTDYTIWDGMTEPTITFQMSSEYQNMVLHCVVTDGKGDTLTSDDAKLTLLKAIEITTQPEDITTSVGEKVTLAVVATGDGLTYQWQYKKTGGDWTSWKNFKSASMTTKATSAWDGMKIRCIISDAYGNTATTREVQSSFGTDEESAITITSEPQDIITSVGESVTLSVVAIGDGLTYQWQYKKSGGDWTSWKNYKSASMTTKATSAWNGMKIRCIITDSNGNTVTTREVQSSFKSSESAAITITSEPQDITTSIGESVTLSVLATGDGLTYQWQYKKTGGDWTSWKNYKSASMTTKATAAWNGMKIRCIITDVNGKEATTREVQCSFQSIQSEDVIIESKNETILEEIEAVDMPQEETTTEEYVEIPQEETEDISSDTTEEVVETSQEDTAIEETLETIE